MIHFIYLLLSNKMFRLLTLLHIRSFSAISKSNSNSNGASKMCCKMTHGGPPITDCTSSCVTKCQIMETRDEVDAFLTNARCRARCAHTNAHPRPGDCSCTNVCIADMSELYCIMSSNSK